MLMNKDAKIFVAGHRGLAGSAIVRELKAQGYCNLLLKNRDECDLTDRQAVKTLFEKEKPDYVFLAAAKVGGILANSTYPADFIRENLLIQNNVIEAAYHSKVKRLLFLGSSCIYPKNCPQPIKEEYLLTGELEATNRPYAIAKIAGIEMCWAYNRQYGTQYIAAMPTNLYGPNDNFDLQTSHVLPALIRKIHEAKVTGAKSITAWGTGMPRREFLYVDDLANACVFLMNLPNAQYQTLLHEDKPPIINVGCGEDISIKELVELIKEVIGYQGKVIWDTSKPDGTMRKVLEIGQLPNLGWQPKVALKSGIAQAYQAFLTKAE